jgi:hypothetical protein
MQNKFRKKLSIPGLLNQVKSYFKKISVPKTKRKGSIPLSDCLMSGLAIFSLKCPSLLQFDKNKREPTIKPTFITP